MFTTCFEIKITFIDYSFYSYKESHHQTDRLYNMRAIGQVCPAVFFLILHTTSHCWVQVNATLGKNVLVWFSQFGRFITSTQQRHSCWREIWAKGCSQSETTAAPHLPVWPCRTGRYVLSLDKVGRHVRQTSSFKADWEIQFLNIKLNTGMSSTNSLIESLNIQVDHKMVIALHDFKLI